METNEWTREQWLPFGDQLVFKGDQSNDLFDAKNKTEAEIRYSSKSSDNRLYIRGQWTGSVGRNTIVWDWGGSGEYVGIGNDPYLIKTVNYNQLASGVSGSQRTVYQCVICVETMKPQDV